MKHKILLGVIGLSALTLTAWAAAEIAVYRHTAYQDSLPGSFKNPIQLGTAPPLTVVGPRSDPPHYSSTTPSPSKDLVGPYVITQLSPNSWEIKNNKGQSFLISVPGNTENWRLVSASPLYQEAENLHLSENLKVTFQGKLTLSGKYSLLPDELFGEAPWFTVDQEPNDTYSDFNMRFFWFNNKEEARNMFFAKQPKNEGRATIIISEYSFNRTPTVGWHGVHLTEVSAVD